MGRSATISYIKAIGICICFCIIWLPKFLYAQSDIRVGFCLAGLHADRWYRDRDYLIASLEEKHVKVFTKIADDDADLQYKQALELLDNNIDVLIIVAVDAKSASLIVERAHERNVKVIAYDRLILDCNLDFYVSFDGIKVGELLASYAFENCPTGKYVLIEGPVSDFNSILFQKGKHNILDSLVHTGNIRIIFEENMDAWNQVTTFLAFQKFIKNGHSQFDVILSSQDKLSAGAIMALENEGLTIDSMLITGQDASLEACKNILLGKQDMTIYKPVDKLARVASDVAIALAKNQSVEYPVNYMQNGKMDVPSILLEPIVVDKHNIDEILFDTGYYDKKDISFKSLN